METTPTPRGIDARVWKNICFKANRLATRRPIAGMTADDYRQDLVLDLVRRSAWFDPARASFPTFADRVVAHRAATLTEPTVNRQHERMAISLDAMLADESNSGLPVPPQLRDAAPPIDDAALARVDIGRFVLSLTPALRRCCAMLQGDGITREAKAARIHRSTVYSHLQRLRELAVSAGLGVYVDGMSDSSDVARVGDGENTVAGRAGRTPEPAMTAAPRPSLARNLRDLEAWLRTAAPGERLEYHRGYLVLDRGAGSPLGEDAAEELDQIAIAVMEMAKAGQVHLIQHRHEGCDYSYIAVMAGHGSHHGQGRLARGRR